MTIRVVHYINQFFAGLGGEDTAHVPPESRDGFVGPGMQIDSLLGEEGTVVGTVICGDSYYGEHIEEARADVLERIRAFEPDLVIAGPAFNAGRYGVACGDVSSAVSRELELPVVTAMYPENPGVEMYAKDAYIVPTVDSVRGMRKALPAMVQLGLKLVRNEEMGTAEEEGYLSRGRRQNFFFEKNGAERAIEMALLKLRGEAFRTEFEMPVFDKVSPAPAIADLAGITVALVNSGGVVPAGNPDRIEVSAASKFGAYQLAGLSDLTGISHESVHGGYDRTYVNDDPDRVVPLDVLREMESEGVFGKLYDYFFATVGTGTPVKSCTRFGQEIAERLKKDGVDAVLLTST